MNQVETKRRQIEFVSYMMGIFTIWLFFSRTGNAGMAYLAAVVELFFLLWTIIGGAVTDALGKVLRSRNMKGQYKNASNLKKNTIFVQGILGALGSLVLLLFAEPIAKHILYMPYCVLLIRLIAPAVFLRTITGVLLGYFQGDGTELCSCVSCILRQILILGFGFWFSGKFVEYGEKISKLLQQEQVLSMYASAGMALAITVSELLIVLLLIVFYRISKRTYKRQNSEGMKATDSFLRSLQILYRNMGGRVVIMVLELMPFVCAMILYVRNTRGGVDATVAYGSYVVKYLAVCGFIIFPLCAMLMPLYGKIAGCIRKEEHRLARTVFQAGLHSAVIWALFFAVFICSMSDKIAGIFGKENLEAVVSMLRGGSFIILFMVLSFYFSNLLSVMGKQHLVLRALIIYVNLFVILVSVMLNVWHMGISALVYSGVLSQAIYALAVGFLAFRQMRSGVKALYVLAIPVVGANIAGIIGLLLGKLLVSYIGNGATIVICLLLSFLSYLVMILLLHNINEQDMEHMPGRRLFSYLGELLRVL